jgi:hypothetical protein
MDELLEELAVPPANTSLKVSLEVTQEILEDEDGTSSQKTTVVLSQEKKVSLPQISLSFSPRTHFPF